MRALILRALIVIVIVLFALGGALSWLFTALATVSASALPAYSPDLANGKSMFHAGGCSSCHATREQEDRNRLGGGLELKSPFGTFYAPNISPDPSDGIGAWTES